MSYNFVTPSDDIIDVIALLKFLDVFYNEFKF